MEMKSFANPGENNLLYNKSINLAICIDRIFEIINIFVLFLSALK